MPIMIFKIWVIVVLPEPCPPERPTIIVFFLFFVNFYRSNYRSEYRNLLIDLIYHKRVVLKLPVFLKI